MLRRAAAVAGLTLAVLAAGALPARAEGGWGSVDCEQNPYPGCELGVGGAQEQPAPGDGSADPAPGGSAGTGSSNDSGGGDNEEPEERDPDVNLADCSYEPSDYEPPQGASPASFTAPAPGAGRGVQPVVLGSSRPAVPVAEPEPGEEGAWYVYRCTGEDGVRDAYYRPPVWIPDAPGEATEAGPTPAQLAEQARDQLRLPSPRIETSPAGDQLVRVPTWLWLEPEGWEEISATASVPGVSVTAVASPVSVTWEMGDGTEVVCDGPGTAYETGGAPEHSSPDCGHTYTSSSAGQPGEAYAVSARVSWTVTWSGAGEEGEFPGLTTQTSTSFRVLESQALTE
ncbi:hypothetical protein [Streptomyces specialis]|uniref:hypothetical protein n=1 Tax=Streptomyces specialis TaxID=498367 RepID=UPI00073EC62D|nr:hypothetical protein [Streptomyces specialis]